MQFHCIINCLRRPRNLAIAVECSAMQGYAKQRSYIFVYTHVHLICWVFPWRTLTTLEDMHFDDVSRGARETSPVRRHWTA